MKRKKVRVCQNLGTVAKAQRLLWKCEQDRAKFKRLYVYEAMGYEKAVRRLEKENYRKFDLMASKRLEEKIKAIIG